MKKIAYLGSSFLLPLLAFAAITDIQSLGDTVLDIINGVLVPIVFAIAFIVFIWGIFQYFIQGTSDEQAKEKGKSLMLWGLIGFFLMVSVWGLVNILVGTFDLNNAVPDLPPTPGT